MSDRCSIEDIKIHLLSYSALPPAQALAPCEAPETQVQLQEKEDKPQTDQP